MDMSMGGCPWLAVTVWTWMLWMTWAGHGRDMDGTPTHGRDREGAGGQGPTPSPRLIAITDQYRRWRLLHSSGGFYGASVGPAKAHQPRDGVLSTLCPNNDSPVGSAHVARMFLHVVRHAVPCRWRDSVVVRSHRVIAHTFRCFYDCGVCLPRHGRGLGTGKPGVFFHCCAAAHTPPS